MSRFRIVGRGPRLVGRLVLALGLVVGGFTAFRSVAAAGVSPGYWLVATDGGIFNYGGAVFHGSSGALPLNQPIVGMAPTPTGKGYWLVATDGGIFSYGDAAFFGSTGSIKLNQPIVGMAATPTGKGYWMVASDGGIFAFGDAGFFGSMGGQRLNKPVVDIAATPSGRGYWMVASDGGIFAFGDAGFYGSTGSINLVQRIQAMTPTRTGQGYWFVAGDGGVFAYGDAVFHGSASGQATDKRILDMAASPGGGGYYLVDTGGRIYEFGDAEFLGDTRATTLNKRITGMAVVGGNRLPTVVEDAVSVAEDRSITVDVLANDLDLDGDVLTLTSVSPASHGTAQIAGSKITYKPAPDYSGPDSFVYAVRDSTGDSNTGVVRITVDQVDDTPRARDDSIGTKEGVQVVIPVLANDDGLGDGGIQVQVLNVPSGNTVTVNGANEVVYQTEGSGPRSGSTVTFKYRVTDVDGDSSDGTVTVNVARLPNAVDDVVDGVHRHESTNINVLRNDVRGSGVPSVELIARNGCDDLDRFTVESDSSVTFYSDRSGNYCITYRFTDGTQMSDTAQIQVEVENRDPSAIDDQGGPGIIFVMDNDSDPDGDAIELLFSGPNTTPEGGVYGCGRTPADHPRPDQPACEYHGPTPASFNYQIKDDEGATSTGTVTIQ